MEVAVLSKFSSDFTCYDFDIVTDFATFLLINKIDFAKICLADQFTNGLKFNHQFIHLALSYHIAESRYRSQIVQLRMNHAEMNSKLPRLKAADRRKAEAWITESEFEIERLMSVHRIIMERDANCSSSRYEATAGRPQLRHLQVESSK